MPVISDIVTTTRASTGTYFDADGVMKVEPINVWRRDHDPVTKQPLGVLIEEQRTNLLTYSEQLNHANWVAASSSVSPNVAVAPDGTATAELVVPNTASVEHYIQQHPYSATGPRVDVHSAYVKSGGYDKGFIRALHLGGSENGTTAAYFDLASKYITPPSDKLVGSGIEELPNGWFRVWAAISLDGTATTYGFRIHVAAGLAYPFAGNGSSGLYIWGSS